jgi:hypothetical protein
MEYSLIRCQDRLKFIYCPHYMVVRRKQNGGGWGALVGDWCFFVIWGRGVQLGLWLDGGWAGEGGFCGLVVLAKKFI